MRKCFNISTLLFLICLSFSLYACSDETQSGESQNAQSSSVKSDDTQNTTPDLVLGVMPSMDYLPLAVAQREGYFKDLGIAVNLHKFYSANERDAALQSGNIDGAVIDYTGALLQKAGGLDLRLTSRCDAPFYIIASAKSGITSLAGLKGASIAVSRNTVIDYCVDMSLESAGLAPEEARKVEINKIPLRYEMLRDGQIDATGLPNPLAIKARQDGGLQLASNADLGFSITGIVFSSRAIANKPEQLRKLYQAYNLGVAYLAGHETAAVADILKQDMGFTDEILSRIDLGDLPAYTPAALPSQADLDRAAGWLIRKGLLPADFDCAAITDGDFLGSH
ncbi:MAG: ABC transporter substrate-binding protein [Deltaproteobacteria bacterium]|jgi:NitT/TauT family transport system substrate-binding protein|nr:ABC transporter substrate-binding protein [Deltaproteobacteria bacterium]